MKSRFKGYFCAAALAGMFAFGPAAQGAVFLNEIRLDQGGADNDEYFELAGNPGESLNDLWHIVIGDGANTGIGGAVESIVSLTGSSIPADGYFLAAESTFTLGTPDLSLGTSGFTQTLNFENSDNVTHLLVQGLNLLIHTGDGFGGSATDLDANDDGIIDATGDWDGDTSDDGAPWTAILDSVVFNENVPSEDLVYSSNNVGPDGSFVPGHGYRFPNATGNWQIGGFTLGTNDTPGAANVPEPTSLTLLGIGAALALRRRR